MKIRADSLIERLPMSYASVIYRVAEGAIRECPCYKHLCGHCGDARVVLNALIHIHVRSENGDNCGKCGLDLRHEIHTRY